MTTTMPLFHSDTASPAIQFWIAAIAMAAAAILAPGAVIGIAAFPLFVIAIVYGIRGFRFLPAARQRPSFTDTLWFIAGLLGTLLFSILHGAIAVAMAHPATGADTPPLIFTLTTGLLPIALSTWAVERRIERGWPVASSLMIGLILVNPVVLLVGRTLELPMARSW